MKNFTLTIGACYGMLSVILGALASHAFKKMLPLEKIGNIEIGIRYQMYTALVLIVLGFFFKFETNLEKWIVCLLMLGAFLFSTTIYFLSFQEYWGINLRALGPITPFGGFLMIVGWLLLIIRFIKI